jgi:hypothetical protein
MEPVKKKNEGISFLTLGSPPVVTTSMVNAGGPFESSDANIQQSKPGRSSQKFLLLHKHFTQ